MDPGRRAHEEREREQGEMDCREREQGRWIKERRIKGVEVVIK
ncbi:hypothetical protein M6D81_01915 [Paenibacillus sp. J5C_2022]|nr:hypothetical protein [Paenibacillus sp. J5C2022]MCU6707453.1 hypothetical protein [Paenibacillus sp. J5C2022]